MRLQPKNLYFAELQDKTSPAIAPLSTFPLSYTQYMLSEEDLQAMFITIPPQIATKLHILIETHIKEITPFLIVTGEALQFNQQGAKLLHTWPITPTLNSVSYVYYSEHSVYHQSLIRSDIEISTILSLDYFTRLINKYATTLNASVTYPRLYIINALYQWYRLYALGNSMVSANSTLTIGEHVLNSILQIIAIQKSPVIIQCKFVTIGDAVRYLFRHPKTSKQTQALQNTLNQIVLNLADELPATTVVVIPFAQAYFELPHYTDTLQFGNFYGNRLSEPISNLHDVNSHPIQNPIADIYIYTYEQLFQVLSAAQLQATSRSLMNMNTVQTPDITATIVITPPSSQ